MPRRFWRIVGTCCAIDIRLTPNAARDLVEGPERLADGREVLKARVRAVPEKGKANKALERLIAKTLGVAKGQVQVVGGQTSRLKTVHVAEDPERMAAKLSELFEGPN